MSETIIVWFRKDLRLEDNPALFAAIKNGSSVVPLYIHDDLREGKWPLGGASRWWLHHALIDLQKQLEELGSKLVIQIGPSGKVLDGIIRKTRATGVYWNRRYEPDLIERDSIIKTTLRKNLIEARSFNASLLFEPHTIQNKSGKPFQVFTRFWKHCRQLPIDKPVVAELEKLKSPSKWPRSESIKKLGLLPSIKWDSGFYDRWTPTRKGAAERLKQLVQEKAKTYAENRNRPDLPHTSSLSPYLHFGQIGPREIYHAISEAKLLNLYSPQVYLSEIGWREFSYHLIYHFPQTPELPLREKFANFPWKRREKFLKAWHRGETGYPIVDAGMRELWHTGWMHNRVRMITASFLVKHLLQPWQEGAAWFWDTLVDADLANNTQGWQWTAGCGADASPYFRIFNPITQGQKFDPEGVYTRRWVPELEKLPLKHLFDPWTADQPTLNTAGVQLGKTYPKPIVDHVAARNKALDAFNRIK